MENCMSRDVFPIDLNQDARYQKRVNHVPESIHGGKTMGWTFAIN